MTIHDPRPGVWYFAREGTPEPGEETVFLVYTIKARCAAVYFDASEEWRYDKSEEVLEDLVIVWRLLE